MKIRNSSMQLTRAADYAVRVMVQLIGQPAGMRTSLVSLSEATAAPESFLSKVLQTLTRAGMIHSQRGQSGGFEISQHGRGASMLEVIEAIGGPVRLNVCLSTEKSCARKVLCPAHPVWVRAQEAMLGVLRGTSIVELAEQAAGVAAGRTGSRSESNATARGVSAADGMQTPGLSFAPGR
jgi:Rrf2 family protein